MMMHPSEGSSTLPAGHGAIRMTTIDPPTRAEEECAPVGQQISFPVLRFSYPLKLIVSRPYRNDLHKLQVGLVYLLNYGGGLLSGDRLTLDIQVDDKCQLLCLSQGSTKGTMIPEGVPPHSSFFVFFFFFLRIMTVCVCS
jgi:hypothetical protein